MYSTIEQGEQTKVLSPHPVRGPLEGCEENTGFEKKEKENAVPADVQNCTKRHGIKVPWGGRTDVH